jgi:hypothetical protein
MILTKKSFSLAIILVLTVICFSFVTKASAAPAQVDPLMANPSPTEMMNAMPVSPGAMMGNVPANADASSSANSADQQDITVGQNLFLKFKNNPPSCQSLSSDDFAKIGEYMLTQQLGAASYMQMGQMIQQDTEKQQIYTAVGKNATDCSTSPMMPAPTASIMMDTNKTTMQTSSFQSPIVLGFGIGILAAMLINIILTIVVLSKMKGNKEIRPKNDTSGGIKSSTPTAPTPSSHAVTASPLFSSEPAPVHPTPAPDHTPPPLMPDTKTPSPSHEPPKPPMFS